jgi:hypothetical protein
MSYTIAVLVVITVIVIIIVIVTAIIVAVIITVIVVAVIVVAVVVVTVVVVTVATTAVIVIVIASATAVIIVVIASATVAVVVIIIVIGRRRPAAVTVTVTITLVVVVARRLVRIHEIAIPVANRHTGTGIFAGTNGLCFLFHDAPRDAVINNLKLFGPANGLNLDLANSVVDLDPFKTLGLEVSNDLIGDLVRYGSRSQKCDRHSGKYCAFHSKVLSCPVRLPNCRQPERDRTSDETIFADGLNPAP